MQIPELMIYICLKYLKTEEKDLLACKVLGANVWRLSSKTVKLILTALEHLQYFDIKIINLKV